MTQIEQSEQWLKAFENALDNQDRTRAIELDDLNQNSEIDWALMPEKMSIRYEDAVERYLNLVL